VRGRHQGFPPKRQTPGFDRFGSKAVHHFYKAPVLLEPTRGTLQSVAVLKNKGYDKQRRKKLYRIIPVDGACAVTSVLGCRPGRERSTVLYFRRLDPVCSGTQS